MRKDFGWTYFLVHSAVFWSVAGGLILVLYIRRRRQQLRRLETLRAADPPDAPAYWLGEEVGDSGDASGDGEPIAGPGA